MSEFDIGATIEKLLFHIFIFMVNMECLGAWFLGLKSKVPSGLLDTLFQTQ